MMKSNGDENETEGKKDDAREKQNGEATSKQSQVRSKCIELKCLAWTIMKH